jgi:hypothetical protein
MTNHIVLTDKQLNQAAKLMQWAIDRNHNAVNDQGKLNPLMFPPGYRWAVDIINNSYTFDYWATGFNGDDLSCFHYKEFKGVWIRLTFKIKLKLYGFKGKFPTTDMLCKEEDPFAE